MKRATQANMLLSAGSMAKLRKLAEELGYIAERGAASGLGNVSAMVDAIAKGEVTMNRDDWLPQLEDHQIKTLESAGMYNAEIIAALDGLGCLIRAEAGTPDGLVMMAWWNDGSALEDLDWYD